MLQRYVVHGACDPGSPDASRRAGTGLWKTKKNPKLRSHSCNLSNFLQTEPGIYFLKDLWAEEVIHLGSPAADLSAFWPCH